MVKTTRDGQVCDKIVWRRTRKFSKYLYFQRLKIPPKNSSQPEGWLPKVRIHFALKFVLKRWKTRNGWKKNNIKDIIHPNSFISSIFSLMNLKIRNFSHLNGIISLTLTRTDLQILRIIKLYFFYKITLAIIPPYVCCYIIDNIKK